MSLSQSTVIAMPTATARTETPRAPSPTSAPDFPQQVAPDNEELAELRRAFERTFSAPELVFVHEVGFGFRATSGVLSSADVTWTGAASYPGANGWVRMERGDFGDSDEVPEGASPGLGQLAAPVSRTQPVNPVDIISFLRPVVASLHDVNESLRRDDGSTYWSVTAEVDAALPALRGQLGTIDELTARRSTQGAEMQVTIDVSAEGTVEQIVLSLNDWWAAASGVEQDQWVHVAIDLDVSGTLAVEGECPDAAVTQAAGVYCETARTRSV